RAFAGGERIVFRDRPIGVDAYDLAVVGGKILRLVAFGEAIADRDEQRAVLVGDEAPAEVDGGAGFGLGTENDFQVGESRRCAVFELGARDAEALAVRAAFEIGEI